MTARRFIPMLLALAIGAPGVTMAQDPDRERERAQLEEAQRRVEEAQERLRDALAELRRSQGEEANRELQRAVDALRRAQRELQSSVYEDLVRSFTIAREGGNAIVLSGAAGRPKMGVILGDEDWRSATDSIGARLQGITPSGPAEEAGLRAGDVIITANGQALGRRARRDRSPNDLLVEVISGLEEGDTLHVVYLRDGQRWEADVIVRPVEPMVYSLAFSGDSLLEGRFRVAPEVNIRIPEVAVDVDALTERIVLAQMFLPYRWLDMELAPLDEEAGQAQFGASEGLLVVRAPQDETLDLRAYDVILNIDGRVPTSPAQAVRIMRSYEAGETMHIEIMRNRQRQTVTATVPDPRERLEELRARRRPEPK